LKKIIVTYATNSGSTSEMALAIGEELKKTNAQVEVLPIKKVSGIESYDALVLGAPMIVGWHRAALRFLRRNRAAIRHIPLAVFVTCMSLTKSKEMTIPGVSVTVDEALPKSPKNETHLTFKERYSLVSNYLRPILKACPIKPVSVGIFGGQLNYRNMQWWAMIFVILILQAQAGDRRNWEAIRSWANGLSRLFEAAASER
jgi:menaquinone-dependent protoporphyrinogen IX oxidase